jgi:hypothetical protein
VSSFDSSTCSTRLYFLCFLVTKEPATVAPVKKHIPTPSSSKSNVSLASTITTSTNEVDFNYNDSDSITDDDASVNQSFNSRKFSYCPFSVVLN